MKKQIMSDWRGNNERMKGKHQQMKKNWEANEGKIVREWEANKMQMSMGGTGISYVVSPSLKNPTKIHFSYMWAMITISRSLWRLWATFNPIIRFVTHARRIFVNVSNFPAISGCFACLSFLVGNRIVSFTVIAPVFVAAMLAWIFNTWRNWSGYLTATLTGCGAT